MGYSKWSDQAYHRRQDHRHRRGETAFTYDRQVRQSGRREVHPQMDPFGVVRQSRDSRQHPASMAIAVLFDVTGSMGHIPQVLQTKLGHLMRVLTEHGLVDHPQLLFGAVGDAHCDAVPLQIGQFESGLEMDDDLGRIYLEGGGGGQVHESYELAYYFMARHTRTDCHEKRGRRGYLFTIGDEMPYPRVDRRQVRAHIGDGLERDLTTAQVIEEAQQRYEAFHIIPTHTAHGREPKVRQVWHSLLGERVLPLQDVDAVCETIALAIGLCEGTVWSLDRGAETLTQAGYARQPVQAAAGALRDYVRILPENRRMLTG